MKNYKIVLVLVVLLFLIFPLSLVFFIKFPFPSTDLDYINRKLTDRLGLVFELKNVYKDVFGNVYMDVAFQPEFYAEGVSVKYDDLLSFLSEGNQITFTVRSNSINFTDLYLVIGYLGLNDEERFYIATNVVGEYLKKVDNATISNLLISKDIFYKYNDKFINAWLDVSVKITKLELGVSKKVDEVKRKVENYFNNFREEVYKDYLLLSSKGQSKITSDVFVMKLDESVKNLKGKLISYQKKIDDTYSKLSLLKEGYKIAWDEKTKMIKSDPQKYIQRYITVFPYYMIRKLVNYPYIEMPKILQLKNVKYSLSKSNEVIYLTLDGDVYNSSYKFHTDVSISNSYWVGILKYYNFEGNKTYIDSNKKIVVLRYTFKPFMDTLNGDYNYEFIYSEDFNITNVVYSILTNASVVDKLVKYMFSEEGFVDSFINEEIDNLFRSYTLQYEKYRQGILKDIEELRKAFYLEVEKEKIKLKKSYQK
ncbi:MAG: hypothetical protein ACPL4C_02235 [Brevinematia bacterium]